MLNIHWQELNTILTRIEAHTGMAERLVRDLLIEEALQIKIKDTIQQNNQSYLKWCNIPDEERNKNKAELIIKYDMGCQKR